MFKEILTLCISKTQNRLLPGLPQSSFPLKAGNTQAQSWWICKERFFNDRSMFLHRFRLVLMSSVDIFTVFMWVNSYLIYAGTDLMLNKNGAKKLELIINPKISA